MEKVEGYTNTSLVFALWNCIREVQWVMFIKSNGRNGFKRNIVA